MPRFLPITPDEVREMGYDVPDFVYVCGDAYVDHPSFGAAIITRVLEQNGFLCAMLCQPDWKSADDFRKFGRPRLGFLVSAGNIDSMVAHYTAAKKKRSGDYYTPGGAAGRRPDRAVTVYCNRIREAYGDVPILIGGLEASLRRCAHYDYWSDKVRRSILLDSRADILMYGMGERSVVRLAKLLDRGVPVEKIRDVRGTAYVCKRGEKINFEPAGGYGDDGTPRGYEFDTLASDRAAYADAFRVQYENNDHVTGRAVVEYYGDRMLVVNPPQPPLGEDELDRVYELPYARTYHPSYEAAGGVPAIEEVKFSITHNRGCFGACNFCAIAFHQGRSVTSRSVRSVVEEAKSLAADPDFKGYIHDVGGPTANFRRPSCKKQLTEGMCKNRKCLVPKPCPMLEADHSEYTEILRQIEQIPGVKKVFVRSGVRYDYVMCDKNDEFLRKLVRDHVSGQLRVAPEHCSDRVLREMGKPGIGVYDRFSEKFYSLCREYGKDQYLVPYLMSSHPGGTVDDALELALYTKRAGIDPDQVQDFYPTPGTASTVMYYTGIDPFTGKKVYTPTDPREKKICRALLQWRRRENRAIIAEAEDYCSPRGKEMLRELLENGKNTGKNVKKTASRRETKKPERKKKR
ncbi:MAG: YgiQ family radical SAM protein [Clostridia bacterium]|nr:YgiQ family radical SAM protein [Clostridia bacterium]